MPFATPAKKASFIDPTVSIKNGTSCCRRVSRLHRTVCRTRWHGRRDQDRQRLRRCPGQCLDRRKRRPPASGIRGPDWRFGRDRLAGAKTIGLEQRPPRSSGPSQPVSDRVPTPEIDAATIDAGAIVSALALGRPRRDGPDRLHGGSRGQLSQPTPRHRTRSFGEAGMRPSRLPSLRLW